MERTTEAQLAKMREINQWQENYNLTIKVAIACIALGSGVIFAFDGKWLTFWGSLFIGLGFVAFFFAYRIKSKYLNG